MLTSRKFNFCIGILVSILIMGSFVAAQDDSVRKELEAVYAKRDQAIKARDADFLKSLLAADYKEKDKDGKITNRTDVTNSFDKSAADKDITEVSSASKIESIKQGRDANEAIVETSLTLNMTAMMNGQPHQLQVNVKSRDTWMRNETGWKMKFSENVDAAMTQVDAAWINYTSPEGRYAVSLPNQPKVDTDQARKAYRAMSTSLPAVFLVEYLDLGTDSTFSIDDTLKGGMNENSTILARNPINIAGFPGNQLIESKKDSSGDTVMETRITKVGARVYFVVFGYPKSMESDAIKAKGTKFFDSFNLSNDIQANLHPKPETEWKTFEDPKLGVKFSYPGSRVVSAETGFSDPSLLTVWVKLNDTPAAGTNLWSEYYLKKNPAEDCSKYFEKANPADIPVGISKTKTIDGVVFQLAVLTIDVTGFGNDYSSVGLQYYGVLGRNCWVADYSENNLKGAPKPDPKAITAMRADFLRWLDSIDIQAVK